MTRSDLKNLSENEVKDLFCEFVNNTDKIFLKGLTNKSDITFSYIQMSKKFLKSIKRDSNKHSELYY
jgi:hypothetical protein